MARTTLGDVTGFSGQFGRVHFFSIRLSKSQAYSLDALLAQAGARGRNTTTLTATFSQPDRLCLTEVEPPAYELRAAVNYVRGNAVRVHGKEGVSCGLDMSARFGVPLVSEQLKLACDRARDFVELRVPSRRRDLVEFVPDVDLSPSTDDAVLISAQVAGVAVEDFSDWDME